MKRKIKSWIICVLTLCILLTSCRYTEVHEENVETELVRIYDVIPVPEYSEAYGQYQYEFHTVRHGMAYSIGAESGLHASFNSTIEGIEYRSGMDIEYVILGSWDELRQALEESRGDGATKLVLYNNSYDESLIKEVLNGGYMDFEPLMEKTGIYDDEDYQQTVLKAGKIGTQQLLVPILYNVSGMVGATDEYEMAEPTYDEFLQMIEDQVNNGQEYAQISAISTAILEERDPDLFWYAAGEAWDDYENQEELFNELHEYLSKYWNEAGDEIELKDTWARYVEKNDQMSQDNDTINSMSYLTVEELEELKAENEGDGEAILWPTLLSQTAYMVESSGSGENAYHSVMGLVNWSMSQVGSFHWWGTLASDAGKTDLGYWPIQMLNKEGYAAQPTCYVAALDDGNAEAAFKVVQELLKQSFALQFGFTTYTPTWREKFDRWCSGGNMQAQGMERIVRYYREPDRWEESQGFQVYHVYRNDSLAKLNSFEDLQSILDYQLSNIQFAQIVDAEVQAIWQETLTESVQSGLSAGEGFELLYERMEEWHKEIN